MAFLALRWTHLPRQTGYDPTPLWLEKIHHASLFWPVLAGALLLIAVFGAVRLGWPQPQEEQLPWRQAWMAYLLMSLGSFPWMALWPGLSMLATQFIYGLWVAACLWPMRRHLRWQFTPGWWKWALCAFGLATLGAFLYGWLFQPAPSMNRAVDLLLKAGPLEKITWLVNLCLLTPVLEESWYRGLLSGPRPARLLLSALVFGVIHADPSALPQLIWLGLIFGWARWGGGLPAAVLAHALWNALVALYLLGA